MIKEKLCLYFTIAIYPFNSLLCSCASSSIVIFQSSVHFTFYTCNSSKTHVNSEFIKEKNIKFFNGIFCIKINSLKTHIFLQFFVFFSSVTFLCTNSFNQTFKYTCTNFMAQFSALFLCITPNSFWIFTNICLFSDFMLEQ